MTGVAIRPTCSTPNCVKRPWGETSQCSACRQRGERQRAKAALPIPQNCISHTRTPEEKRRAAGLVVYLSTLSDYELARHCELVLAAHHDGIEVRPERRKKRRAA